MTDLGCPVEGAQNPGFLAISLKPLMKLKRWSEDGALGAPFNLPWLAMV